MAVTIRTGGRFITAVPDGSTDHDFGDMILDSIQFVPSATNDECIIRDSAAGGVEIFHSGAVTSVSPVVKYYPEGTKCRPYLDDSECTWGTAANVRIMLVFT